MDIYKVGDKVRFTGEPNFMHPPKGTVGEIARVDGDGVPLVAWKKGVFRGRMEYCSQSLLDPELCKVLIMQDKKDPMKVVARDLITDKTAAARCNPDDTFDFSIGALIALGRLYEHEPEITKGVKPEEKQCPAFKVGDTVRMTHPEEHGSWGAEVGSRPMTIKSITGDSILMHEVPYCFGPEWLEPFTFKIGDPVVANASARGYYGITVPGWKGYVVGIPAEGTIRVSARKSDVTGFAVAARHFDYDLHRDAKPAYYSGKLVCIYSDYGIWTVGKVYPVVDGTIYDNKGLPRFEVESAQQLTSRLSYPGGEVHFAVLQDPDGMPKATRGWSADLVCVKSAWRWWTPGKVYSVKGGVILDDDGDFRTCGSLEAFNDMMEGDAEFSILKE